MRQALRTWVTNFRRCSSVPMAEPPSVGPQTGATTDPMTNPLARILSASALIWSSLALMFTCGSKRNRSTPSNFTPLTEALAVKASIVSRSMGGSESGPLPTRPGHMALCSLGSWFMGAPLDLAWSSCRSHGDVCRTVRVALVRSQHPRLAASGNHHGPRAMLRAPSLPKRTAEGKPLLLDFCRPRREPKPASRYAETQKRERGRGWQAVVRAQLQRNFTTTHAA